MAAVWALSSSAGMGVTEGDPTNPMTLLTKKRHVAITASPYNEEEATMRMVFDWFLLFSC